MQESLSVPGCIEYEGLGVIRPVIERKQMIAEMKAVDADCRIYVASLSDYNNGILHGCWIDVDGKDADEITEEVQAMLAKSPAAKQYGDIAEEWAIHDHEGLGSISEYESFELIAKLGELITEHGEAFKAWYSDGSHSDDQDLWAEEFSEAYQGQYKSEKDYAEEIVEQHGYLENVPDVVKWHFDYESYARDLFMDGYWSHTESFEVCYVFCRN